MHRVIFDDKLACLACSVTDVLTQISNQRYPVADTHSGDGIKKMIYLIAAVQVNFAN